MQINLKMKKVLIALSLILGAATVSVAQDITYVGGEKMYPTAAFSAATKVV